MRAKTYHINRQALSGNFVLGIDPGKQKHCGVVIDATGMPQGSAFSFPVSKSCQFNLSAVFQAIA